MAQRGKVERLLGVLQNEKGEELVAYLENFGKGNNNEVEAMALLWGLKIAMEMWIKKLNIEGD